MPAPIQPQRRREDDAPSNWDRYLDLLARKGVPETMRPWYLRRVEECLKEVRPESLSRLTEGELTGYLQPVSSRSRLVDWQFRQMVDALQPLLVDLAQTPAGKGVDGDDLKAGGRVLAPSHPTLVGSQAPERTVERLASGPTFARAAQGFPILASLARTIRGNRGRSTDIPAPSMGRLPDPLRRARGFADPTGPADSLTGFCVAKLSQAALRSGQARVE